MGRSFLRWWIPVTKLVCSAKIRGQLQTLVRSEQEFLDLLKTTNKLLSLQTVSLTVEIIVLEVPAHQITQQESPFALLTINLLLRLWSSLFWKNCIDMSCDWDKFCSHLSQVIFRCKALDCSLKSYTLYLSGVVSTVLKWRWWDFCHWSYALFLIEICLFFASNKI